MGLDKGQQCRRSGGGGSSAGVETVVRLQRGYCVSVTEKTAKDDDGDRDCVHGVRATVLEVKTDITRLQTNGAEQISFSVTAVGQVYRQTTEFV